MGRCSFRIFSAIFILSCVLGRPILAEEGGDTETEMEIETEMEMETEGPKVTITTVFSPPDCIRKVEKKDFVRYQYYGMLEDGTYFDSSHSRGYSYDTFVFNGWLIPGMDEGLLGMCVNEHRIISIPPQLAYGERGTASGSIPGNATIVFNTILLDIWNEKDKIAVVTTKAAATCDRKIKDSDYVRYHYNGTLMNGQAFHSSYADKSTYNTYVGQGWLIKGMDQGLIGACMGERRRIAIPPMLAYGEKGDGKNIPGSATVIFDVEIVDFHNPSDTVQVIPLEEVEDCPRKLEASDFIRYHYNGTFMDGTIFDSSYQRNRTYDTYVGIKRLIPGVDRGIIGVCMGEKRRLIIPPHLGYGEPGVDGVIPASAVLIFDIHVIDFHNPKDTGVTEVLHQVVDKEARTVAEGDYVKYAFHLSLMDGTVLDDSSENSTFGAYVGRRDVPEGVEMALTGMQVGDKKKITIPPHIGFGEFGRENYVPGSAVLIYTLEVNEIHDGVGRGEWLIWKKQLGAKEANEHFKAADVNSDEIVDKQELTDYLIAREEAGDLYLAPHRVAEELRGELVAEAEADTIGEGQFVKWLRLIGSISTEIKNEL